MAISVQFWLAVNNSVMLREDVTLKDFCEALNAACVKPHLYANYPAGKPYLRPSSLKNIIGGSCDDYVGLFHYAARTFGVPVALDFTPQWANHSQGHRWCATMANDTLYHIEVGDRLRIAADSPFTYKMVKAYRKTGVRQQNSFADRYRYKTIPKHLSDPRNMDVTSLYGPVVDIHLNNLQRRKGDKLVYLCVFDDKDWVPVCGTRRKGRNVVFKDVGYPAAFLVQYYDGERYIPASEPFIVDSTGKIQILKPDFLQLRSVRLLRKYSDVKARRFANFMARGRFELSNNPDFSYCQIYEIGDSVGYNYQTIKLDVAKRFRYIRYIPPIGKEGSIAEIEVIGSNGQKLYGRPIGNYNPGEEPHFIQDAFDGDALSYAYCPKDHGDAWIGIDLGGQEIVTSINFLPRSDDNFIKEGELYELCYWNNGWKSLGFQIGSRTTQELAYDNVPESALLILHNRTKGKEERIFTYEKGCQVWW